MKAIKQAREIVTEMDAKYNPREVRPGPELTTTEQLVKAAGGTSYFHLQFICVLMCTIFALSNWYHYFSSCWNHEDGDQF